MPTTETAATDTLFPLLSASDLDRLVRQHGRRLHNFIRRRVGNTAGVDDLVQDTCLEALRCLQRYQGHSRPETWLFGIALNLVRGHYKQARARPAFEEEDEGLEAQAEMAEDPRETLERLQEITRMLHVVDHLPAASACVLTLVFDERLTYEQAASRLQIPVGTVRSRIARARALLRGHTTTTKEPIHP
jgi:RNA polymerase sigma factor (sigma-70 family)